jgi:hypothetical protein
MVDTNLRDLPMPEGVQPPDYKSYEAVFFLEEAFENKKPVVYGGLSILGETKYPVRIAIVMRPGLLFPHGWAFIQGGSPELKQGLFRINLLNARHLISIAPNFKTYVAGEVDRSLTRSRADRKRVEEVLEWALSHIHD